MPRDVLTPNNFAIWPESQLEHSTHEEDHQVVTLAAPAAAQWCKCPGGPGPAPPPWSGGPGHTQANAAVNVSTEPHNK